jgi:hypothetical protein
MSAQPELLSTARSSATPGRAARWFSLGETFANRINQFRDGDAETIRQLRQQTHLHSDAADFVVANRLLRKTQRIGELLLSQILIPPEFRNTFAERPVERFLVRYHRIRSRQWMKP